MEEAASRLEREHVHGVYDKIAPYFNDSRYKAWPKVRQFLLDQPPGSIVADVGCGNGKYLGVNEEAFKLGCDVCRPLVDVAGSRGHEVQMCDGLRLPYRDGCFDAVLSIAVIHHLSTKERRIRAIREMARTLRAGGRVMIYVWAMEQKRRKFEKQDIFVPWNPNLRSPDVGPPSPPPGRASAKSAGDDGGDKHRKVRSTSSVADGAPHRLWFFSRSLDSVLDFGSLSVSRLSSRELSTIPGGAAGRQGPGWALIQHFSSFFSPPSTVGSEEDVFGPGADLHKEPEDVKEEHGGGAALAPECGALALPDLVPFQREGPARRESAATDASCLRYYHVFREGELAQLIADHVAQLRVRQAYFDHANWCVVAEKVEPGKI
ncbi:probable tRNA methyltransferase 9B [Hippocampus zosterae]|uniref:probable tRNA methyltransferase 9B n=1 Tax=Hippocampus zosterae TaxID=109293 RepID=UPI00223CA686|nr:probable tRNA methyltransferase 9B [Hippocampus zosterae]